MLLLINGFDYTTYLDCNDVQITQSANDPAPTAQVTVSDQGSALSFQCLQEVILWDEAAPPAPTSNPSVTVAQTPAHNLVQLTDVSGASGGAWATSGPLSLFSGFAGLSPTVTFSNTTYSGSNNTSFITAITPPGYIHAGQQYMLSVYATIATPLVNALAVVKMQFQDATGALIGSAISTTFSSTTENAQQRVNIKAYAPPKAMYIQCWLGGQATTSGTNSGAIVYGSPQCEPMWFADRTRHTRPYALRAFGCPVYYGASQERIAVTSTYAISYPTPDCNVRQADCAAMPDATTSRAVRLFSGFISGIQISYDGPDRLWQLACAGPGALLESGNINGTYTAQYDDDIISDVASTYFPTQIAINAANIVAPSPLTQGAYVSSISYGDNTFREVLNGRADASGYVFYIDAYYRLWYQPAFFNAASFTLIDGTADNSTSFNYYDYSIEYDGTQLKRRIKITGGDFRGTYQDVFSGDGTTKQFTLTLIPDAITSLTVGGTSQKVGVYGRDTLGGSIQALLNVQSKYILFNTAPPNSANNTVCTYTYQAPVTTQTSKQTSAVIAPAYAVPYFDAKINDSNITDLATATQRGLTEIIKFGDPLTVIKFKSSQFSAAGTSIYFTSTLDGIVNAPIQVQSITGIHLGAGLNEFQYTCGTAYQPTLVDHIRNANKAVNRSKATANVAAIQQYDVVAVEIIGYRDSISATVQTAYSTSTYGTGTYGAAAYGGATGTYDGTGEYGRSTVYG